MSKHHDWKEFKPETSILILPSVSQQVSAVYKCAKCSLEIGEFTLLTWEKKKYECQPRHVEKGKFKHLSPEHRMTIEDDRKVTLMLKEITEKALAERQGERAKEFHDRWFEFSKNRKPLH